MNKQDRKILYSLFREHGNNLGISKATLVALRAIIESMKELTCTRSDFTKCYGELAEAIKNTEPKIIPLIHILEQFEIEIKKYLGSDIEVIKNRAIGIILKKIKLMESNIQNIVKHGRKYVLDNDVIIVLSPSPVITSILVQAKNKLNRKFRVIVLQQNIVRTKQLVSALKDTNIEYLMIPEYNLSHYLEEATKQFIGAVTVTKDQKILAQVGTANAVSLSHLHNTTVYLFACTLHFSHHLSTDQLIYKKDVTMKQNNFNYCLTTHSHDIVDLKLVDHVITEFGEMGNSL